jgi:hypothetical protein
MAEEAGTHAGPAGWGRYRVLLYFLVGLIALDVAVDAARAVWHAYDPDEYRERLNNCRQRPHDLVLVGGSPVSEGIDPACLRGLRWHGRAIAHPYNFGLPGGTTSEVWHAVEHGLAAPPRLLVYGITASDLNENRDEPQGPRVLMDWRDLTDTARCRPGALEWCVRQLFWARLGKLWQLYRYRNGIRLWAADRVDRLFPGPFAAAAAEARGGLAHTAALRSADGYASDPGGRARRLDVLKRCGSDGPPFAFLNRFCLGGHVAHLQRLLDWAQEHGVAVVLVDMPASADLEERRHPREFGQYREVLAEVSRQRHVPVLYATRAAVGLDDSHFADVIHLNGRGAARFGKWLRRRLEEM